MIEAGQLILPREMPWLAEFKSELLGFPHTRFRDQVDALAQLLAHVRKSQQTTADTLAGPEAIECDSDPYEHRFEPETEYKGLDPAVQKMIKDDPWL